MIKSKLKEVIFIKDFKRFLLLMFIILSIVSIVIPILTMFVWTITNNYVWPNVFPNSFSMRGINYVFTNFPRILGTLKNSIIISIMTMILTILISLPCAKALAFSNFRGKRLIEILVMTPLIIPMVSVGMGLNIEFIKLGLTGTFTGVVIVCIIPCIPYAVSMLRTVYEIVGEKVFQQGTVLGATKMQIFFRLVIPMIMPGIISAAIMCYIISFSQYFLVYLIGSGKIITFTMDMFPFIEAGDRSIGSLYGLIFIGCTVVLLFVMEFILKKVYMKDLKDYKYI